MRYPLSLLLAFAPPLAAATIQPLTFTATAEPTVQPNIYRSLVYATMTVAPNPNSPIPGVDAEAYYYYSYSTTSPSCGLCSWFFNLDVNPWAADTTGFGVDGDPSPHNVEAYGSQAGVARLIAGEYLISLAAFADYPDGAGPVGSLPSISLTLTPIFGSISDPPFQSVDAPEPGTWLLIALPFAVRYLSPRRSRRWSSGSGRRCQNKSAREATE